MTFEHIKKAETFEEVLDHYTTELVNSFKEQGNATFNLLPGSTNMMFIVGIAKAQCKILGIAC